MYRTWIIPYHLEISCSNIRDWLKYPKCLFQQYHSILYPEKSGMGKAKIHILVLWLYFSFSFKEPAVKNFSILSTTYRAEMSQEPLLSHLRLNNQFWWLRYTALITDVSFFLTLFYWWDAELGFSPSAFALLSLPSDLQQYPSGYHPIILGQWESKTPLTNSLTN